jgi:hypothetical protein
MTDFYGVLGPRLNVHLLLACHGHSSTKFSVHYYIDLVVHEIRQSPPSWPSRKDMGLLDKPARACESNFENSVYLVTVTAILSFFPQQFAMSKVLSFDEFKTHTKKEDLWVLLHSKGTVIHVAKPMF